MAHGAFELDDDAVPAASFAEGSQAPRRSVAEDDDPLAAPGYSGDDSPEEEVESDGGFSDSDKLVRVWLEEGRLVRNRISPVWFKRLGPKDSLGNHFREALLLALLDRATRDRESDQEAAPGGPMAELAALPGEVRDVFEALPELDDELLDALDAVLEELDERGEALFTQAETAAPRSFKGRAQGVTVTVDDTGNTVDVEFDEQWLDDVQVGVIVSQVQQAADRAHAAFEPLPGDERVAELLAERQLFSNVLTAILNPRSDR